MPVENSGNFVLVKVFIYLFLSQANIMQLSLCTSLVYFCKDVTYKCPFHSKLTYLVSFSEHTTVQTLCDATNLV